MTKNKTKKTLDLLKAISDETRLSVVLCLVSGEKCVCEIYKHLRLPQNLVSHHLGILRKNQLIEARKDGKWVYYTLSEETVALLLNLLGTILSSEKKESKC